MPLDLLYLRHFYGDLGSTYLQVALLAGLIVATVFRPERIRLPTMFRVSCVLLALSIMTSRIIWTLLRLAAAFNATAPGRTPSRGIAGWESSELLITGINAVSSVLLGMSIIFAVFALVPSARTPPIGPARRPLDQAPPIRT